MWLYFFRLRTGKSYFIIEANNIRNARKLIARRLSVPVSEILSRYKCLSRRKTGQKESIIAITNVGKGDLLIS